MSLKFYDENTKELVQQYLSKSFEGVHQSLSQFLPPIIRNPNARILELGADYGRDSKYLANLATKTHSTESNNHPLVIKPAKELSQLAKKATQGLNVKWLEDSLPELSSVTKQNGCA